MLVCLLIGSKIFSRGEFWGKGVTSEMKITVLQFLTSELRSMSKLFGLFRFCLFFSFSLIHRLNILSLNWSYLYYIQESVQTTSLLVIMESVLVNGDVAITEVFVVMVQMNSSVVSLLSLSPLSKYCSHLSYGLMANYSSCAVVIRSRYKQILGAVSPPSLSISIFSFSNESNN